MVEANTTLQFNKLYKQLNTPQREAVDTIEGPVMVVAGPGTGKTQILTLRVANILRETDAAADSILALTFTEAGVATMRKRLVSIIGQDGYKVAIHTFHGFCNEVIKHYPDEFERIIGSEPITDIEQVSLLRDVIKETDLTHLKPFSNNYYFLAPVRGKISELKREGIPVTRLRKELAKRKAEVENGDDLYHTKGAHKDKIKAVYIDELKRISRSEELAEIYERYEEELRARRLYDYEDMILEVMHALDSNEKLLQRLQEMYQYILADEHQDANGAQNKILELLSNFHAEPNLFIVGDEKQAIFRFQGASLENFNYFGKLYPSAKLITLENNYRSGQNILSGAHSLMDGNTLHNAPLKACGDVNISSIEQREFVSEESELLFIAHDIKEKIEEGVNPSEIAVLYRNNADAAAISNVLERETVPHRVESNQNVLADPDMRKLLITLYAVAEFGSSTRLVKAMHLPFLGLTPSSTYRMLRYSRRERVSIFEILTNKKMQKAALVDTKEVSGFLNKIETLAERARKESVPTFFVRLVRESGFLTYILNSKRSGELLEKLRGLTRLVEELSAKDADYTLSALVEHLQLLEDYNIPVQKDTVASVPQSSVRLMTAHKSKGLEFDYVYIAHVRDKHWGNKRDSDIFKLPELGASGGDNDDERRLFYVALTRARFGVSISFARTNKDSGVQMPSIFLEEIDDKLVEQKDTRKFEEGINTDDIFKIADGGDSRIHDKEFLNDLFKDFGLSVTALNNYLSCPWQYFYRNLVRIPEGPSKHLIFGNAVHSALQYYFEHKQHQSQNLILREFERVLAKQPLTTSEHKESLARGKEAIIGWLENYSGKLNLKTVNELILNVHLGGTLLRGKLDKLELGEGETAIVVDYKTGTPKSRNWVLGNTKSSSGDYYRQLVFYKLILNLHNENVKKNGNGRVYDMVAGEIDFIQPDARGKLHKESFIIPNEDVAELGEVIENVSREILDLSFWNTRCDNHKQGKCKYCELRDLMR